MFKFFGIIKIEPRFMFLSCDSEMSKYYRKLASFSGIDLIAQRIDSHVSIIRTEELRSGQILSNKYQNEEVEFFGNPEYIQNNSSHYWFRIISPRLEEIRLELGFSCQPVEFLENGDFVVHPFHWTFGRINERHQKS